MQPTKLIIIVFLLLFTSCKEKGNNIPPSTPAFDSVFVRAGRVQDSGYTTEALNIMLAARAQMKDLTLTDEINYFNYCNILYGNKKEYDKSIEIADSMLLLLADAGNAKNIMQWRTVAYNVKADALFAKGLYNDAYDYYYKAQKLAMDNVDSCSMRTYTYRLAMVLYKQQRFGESAISFKDAYNQTKPCPEDFNLFYFKQEILDNTGLCYSATNKYDSAMYYYQKAIDYIEASNGKYPQKPGSVFESAKAVVYGNMAEVYLKKNSIDTAEKLFDLSIGINLRKGYANTDALTDQAKLADLYFNRGEIVKMKTVLDAIHAELDSIPERRVALMWNKLMWRYYDHEHDSVTASRYLRTYIVENEAYTAANKAVMTTDLDTRVKDIQKQYQINFLIKDQKQKKIYLIIVTILAIMAMAIVYLVWLDANKSHKNVKKLTDLNNTINDQKEQLELALTELKLKDKDKSRILKSVAHDVMNPIAAIISLTDILNNEAEHLTEEHRGLLNMIKEACDNSLNLSKDILEAAVEMDHSTIAKENVDIHKLVAKSAELLNFKAAAKKQQIEIEAPQGHVQAFVYKEKIWRVINNLISNAIKFSYQNSSIKIRIAATADKVHIAIKDKGIGIPEKNKARIFDMFTDAKVTGTSGEVPHGLGLSISLQIAKAHNGNIWFESEEGKGSTFHLEFPVNIGTV